MKLEDLTGRRFGRLLVLCRLPNKHKHTHWECICDCGTRLSIDGDRLKNEKSKSCGCLRIELQTRHGHSPFKAKPSPEYSSWQHMKDRCYNPNHKHYAYYGGRGIRVCDRWKNSFINFLQDMGSSNGLTLDRINGNGNYEPRNCRWATRREQAINKVRERGLSI